MARCDQALRSFAGGDPSPPPLVCIRSVCKHSLFSKKSRLCSYSMRTRSVYEHAPGNLG